MSRTAMSRATPELVKEFDNEIIAWAVRIRKAAPLRDSWAEWPAASLRYARRLHNKHPSASHVYVLTYLQMLLRKIGERNLHPDPRLRSQLLRVIARLEERVAQLESGL